MMMCDTNWHLCPQSLCDCMGLFLLKRIPWRTEHLLKGSDICLMPLMSLAKIMCSGTRQDLTDLSFSNIKFVIKSMRDSRWWWYNNSAWESKPWFDSILQWQCHISGPVPTRSSFVGCHCRAESVDSVFQNWIFWTRGLLLGVLASHYWPLGDAAYRTAMIKNSANDVDQLSESYPSLVTSQSF